MTFGNFLRGVLADSIDGSSGEWNQGVDYGKRPCIHCGERKRLDDDGWCADCDRSDAAYDDELRARAQAEAPQRYRAIAAGWREQGMTAQADLLDAYVDNQEKDK